MLRRFKRRNERGSAVVEFAIVLPILLFTLFSLIDFGRYFYVRISLSSASFEVADAIARGLFVTGDDQASKTEKMKAVVDEISPGIASFAQLQSPATLTFTPLPLSCPSDSGSTTVALTTPFNSISPIAEFFDDVTTSTTMRCLR